MKSAFRILFTALLVAAIPGKSLAITDVDKAQVNYYNQLKNPGVENGTADYTASGGSLTRVTGSNALFGVSSLSWDASATSQTLQTGLYSSQPGTIGGPCAATFWYKYESASNLPTVAVVNESGTALSSTLTLTTTISPRPNVFVVPFSCPSSGQYRLRFTSTGNADALITDNFYLGGDSRITRTSQASVVGTLYIAPTASCAWSTNSTSTIDVTADSDCPDPVVTGLFNTSAGKIPGGTVSSLPDGIYEVTIQSYFGPNSFGTPSMDGLFRIGTSVTDADGRTNAGAAYSTAYQSSIINGVVQNTLQGTFRYTSAQGPVTFRIQAKTSNASNVAIINNTTTVNGFFMTLKRYPVSPDLNLRVDQLGWSVDANISGTNPSLGTASVSSYTGIENGSLSLTNNSGLGKISAQIPCSGTNPSTGTTCAAGNESLGVAFNLPAAGEVQACASFGWNVSTQTNGASDASFQIVETANTSQTIIQEGKTRTPGRISVVSQQTVATLPFRVCGNFTFTTPGQKTLRLMYEQLVTGALNSSVILGDADSTVGQRDIHWEVYPINYSAGANPVYDGMVTTNGSGRWRVQSAKVNVTSASAGTIVSQSGSWLTLNAVSGTVADLTMSGFSAAPTCSCTPESDSIGVCNFTAAITSTSIKPYMIRSSTEVARTGVMNIVCHGPN